MSKYILKKLSIRPVRPSNDVDFLKCQIDPAPFQLVEKSSLLKVCNY